MWKVFANIVFFKWVKWVTLPSEICMGQRVQKGLSYSPLSCAHSGISLWLCSLSYVQLNVSQILVTICKSELGWRGGLQHPFCDERRKFIYSWIYITRLPKMSISFFFPASPLCNEVLLLFWIVTETFNKLRTKMCVMQCDPVVSSASGSVELPSDSAQGRQVMLLKSDLPHHVPGTLQYMKIYKHATMFSFEFFCVRCILSFTHSPVILISPLRSLFAIPIYVSFSWRPN